ncbi:MAG: site-specific integrase [Planctomycetia bacterium]|nr:site-specific integrase [Planctomycetia bacterium]
MFFVTRDMTAKLLDAAPDAEWRAIIALTRYGGLRCPSELVGLRLTDADWEAGRIRVTSPKTKRHGKGERIIPLFPELRPYLEDVWHDAPEGAVYFITRYRDPAQNLRTTFQKIIARAGLVPWPKLFQNLRSSRQTELEESFPSHVVCAWMGNSQLIAQKHYLQVTDAHFEAASMTDKTPPATGAQNAQHSAVEMGGNGANSPEWQNQKNPKTPGKPSKTLVFQGASVGDEGLEPPTPSV